MVRLKVLAIAVATGRIGYVFIEGDRLLDWRMSKKAYRSRSEACRQVRGWIELFRPDVLITEQIGRQSRKGRQARRLIQAIASIGEQAELLDISVVRVQHHENKYEEASALAERFPDLKARLPRKPRIWESEPFSMIYFEALALALPIIDRRQAG